ncbi:MAG TPA: hypothetical protein VJ970_05685, partial [Flavobacteriaceae bacterium]|nr:hypothetical protein [Flavobacteriaceae bacterium]
KVVKKIPFSVLKSSFNAVVSNLPPDVYTYKVTIDNETFTSSGSFKVIPFNIEEQLVNSKTQELEVVSLNSSGQLFLAGEVNELIQQLVKNEKLKSVVTSTYKTKPLIDWYWLLFIIITLLSFEWFLRKYLGKI